MSFTTDCCTITTNQTFPASTRKVANSHPRFKNIHRNKESIGLFLGLSFFDEFLASADDTHHRFNRHRRRMNSNNFRDRTRRCRLLVGDGTSSDFFIAKNLAHTTQHILVTVGACPIALELVAIRTERMIVRLLGLRF